MEADTPVREPSSVKAYASLATGLVGAYAFSAWMLLDVHWAGAAAGVLMWLSIGLRLLILDDRIAALEKAA